MIPLVTKVKPTDEEVDIDELRDSFKNQSMRELKSQMDRFGVQFDQIDNTDDPNMTIWQEQKQFLEAFADKLEIFDPLDRDINGG